MDSKRQQGIVLIIVLVMLIVISLIGTTAMRSAAFNDRISVNHQHKNLAFEAAESALAQALKTAPDDIVPASTTPGATRSSGDFFASSNVSGQPDLSADLQTTYIDMRNNVVLSGYRFNSNALIYTLSASGEINDTPTRAVNRMGAALIR